MTKKKLPKLKKWQKTAVELKLMKTKEVREYSRLRDLPEPYQKIIHSYASKRAAVTRAKAKGNKVTYKSIKSEYIKAPKYNPIIPYGVRGAGDPLAENTTPQAYRSQENERNPFYKNVYYNIQHDKYVAVVDTRTGEVVEYYTPVVHYIPNETRPWTSNGKPNLIKITEYYGTNDDGTINYGKPLNSNENYWQKGSALQKEILERMAQIYGSDFTTNLGKNYHEKKTTNAEEPVQEDEEKPEPEDEETDEEEKDTAEFNNAETPQPITREDSEYKNDAEEGTNYDDWLKDQIDIRINNAPTEELRDYIENMLKEYKDKIAGNSAVRKRVEESLDTLSDIDETADFYVEEELTNMLDELYETLTGNSPSEIQRIEHLAVASRAATQITGTIYNSMSDKAQWQGE